MNNLWPSVRGNTPNIGISILDGTGPQNSSPSNPPFPPFPPLLKKQEGAKEVAEALCLRIAANGKMEDLEDSHNSEYSDDSNEKAKEDVKLN